MDPYVFLKVSPVYTFSIEPSSIFTPTYQTLPFCQVRSNHGPVPFAIKIAIAPQTVEKRFQPNAVRELTSTSVRAWLTSATVLGFSNPDGVIAQPVQRSRNFSSFSLKAACPDRALALRLAVTHVTQRSEREEWRL